VVHTTLIALHTAAGLIALAAGCLAAARGSRFALYFWSLVACIALLVPAIAVDWGDLGTATRIVFPALIGLGLYMVWRATRARGRLETPGGVSSDAYFEDVGFTLIALFDAFVVIAVLDLGAPGWLIAAAGVAGALVARRAIEVLRPASPQVTSR
jgi:hypothetical protein